jgi:hypothetical protein
MWLPPPVRWPRWKPGQQPGDFLTSHVRDDWGEVPPEDIKENDFSLKHGFRLLSAYHTSAGGQAMGDLPKLTARPLVFCCPKNIELGPRELGATVDDKHFQKGEKDKAFEWLEKGYEERSGVFHQPVSALNWIQYGIHCGRTRALQTYCAA